MNLSILILVFGQYVLLDLVNADKDPVCTTTPRKTRRTNNGKPLPSHDPFIPRKDSILFNCSIDCSVSSYKSLTELLTTNNELRVCFPGASGNYTCERIRYNYFKNADKLLFLSKAIPDKIFYLVDCLVYAGGERVCHKKYQAGEKQDTHANLVDTGTIARPNETNILSQDEFICEESFNKILTVNCDLNPYIPYDDGLKVKESSPFGEQVLLKSGTYVIILYRKCYGTWCGYSGQFAKTRRQFTYRPPGGSVYRCYYAQKQQVCKFWYRPDERVVYNGRGVI